MQEQQGNNNKVVLCSCYKLFGLGFTIYVFWNWIIAS